MNHLSDLDLERYASGMVHHDDEVKYIEDHLFRCPDCTERLYAVQDHLDDPASGSGQTGESDLYRGGGPLQ
jgi:hypothetical protein